MQEGSRFRDKGEKAETTLEIQRILTVQTNAEEAGEVAGD